MQVKLRVCGGKLDGREIKVKGPKYIIGRAEGCHLRPKTDTVSRKHCAILVGKKGVAIKDYGSRNGVYINDVKIDSQTLLKADDELRIGELNFVVLIDNSLASEKRPKVQNVKEVVARASAAKDEAVEEDDVSSWLEEADELDKTRQQLSIGDPETTNLQMDKTEQIILKRGSDETEDKDPGETVDGSSETRVPDPEKKAPGKLPASAADLTKDSREAASNMLRKFFNRR